MLWEDLLKLANELDYTRDFLEAHSSEFILGDYGNQLDEGIIILTENEVEARQFILNYCRISKGNGQRIYRWKKGNFQLDNYCCGLLLLNSKKTEEALEFLEETDFFPILVSGVCYLMNCVMPAIFFGRHMKIH